MLPLDEAGTGSPLVLLHAGIADRSMWSAHLDPLAAAGYRVIAPDLPGFGESPEAPRAPGPLGGGADAARRARDRRGGAGGRLVRGRSGAARGGRRPGAGPRAGAD